MLICGVSFREWRPCLAQPPALCHPRHACVAGGACVRREISRIGIINLSAVELAPPNHAQDIGATFSRVDILKNCRIILQQSQIVSTAKSELR
jgi:hypothetical protein